MDYTVSKETQESYDRVLALPEVREALDFVKKDYAFSLEEHKKFIACEAPTYHEKARAELYAEKLAEYGLEDVNVDSNYNVTALWRGEGSGPTIMIEAHLDTVFPFGSVGEIIDNGTEIHAPGATDDTRGLTALLAALRAMKHAGIRTKGNILFAGTSREEGTGGFGGMKDLVAAHPEIDGSISVDGASCETVTCEATGSRTYTVTFHGIGGHAFSAFGSVANPLHAAARAVAKIADLQVASSPRTTFAVTNFHAGNDAGIHAIVPEAVIKFNFRSNDQQLLLDLDKRIFDAIQEACEEETARWGKDTITWDCIRHIDVCAGSEDRHLPIVEATVLACREFSGVPEDVVIREGGNVNGNIAIGAGIPCVTIGGGRLNQSIHSLKEFFPYTEGWRLPQEAVVLLCLTAGVAGKTEPIVPLRR